MTAGGTGRIWRLMKLFVYENMKNMCIYLYIYSAQYVYIYIYTHICIWYEVLWPKCQFLAMGPYCSFIERFLHGFLATPLKGTQSHKAHVEPVDLYILLIKNKIEKDTNQNHMNMYTAWDVEVRNANVLFSLPSSVTYVSFECHPKKPFQPKMQMMTAGAACSTHTSRASGPRFFGRIVLRCTTSGEVWVEIIAFVDFVILTWLFDVVSIFLAVLASFTCFI